LQSSSSANINIGSDTLHAVSSCKYRLVASAANKVACWRIQRSGPQRANADLSLVAAGLGDEEDLTKKVSAKQQQRRKQGQALDLGV
jgi:hypothetical protein